ncbi:hypothetical protein IYQ_16864 [Aeromonas salmonicida subsp. salmonicida 01-B526]|uniref:Uncharacterized protein n=1 Tax=Aeromonas salmonicida subsp. salmonicida 01-B526 TaxID=1076135 RepID=A0ABN0DWX1_AERSS|nr:hypothetical protein IYQ_16864 [Aeromonas salmonicida subsp. salmonicida 01-B526]
MGIKISHHILDIKMIDAIIIASIPYRAEIIDEIGANTGLAYI